MRREYDQAGRKEHASSSGVNHGACVVGNGRCDEGVWDMREVREAFEQSVKASPSYQKLIFIHGERLFIIEDGQYKIAAIQLAWELWQGVAA